MEADYSKTLYWIGRRAVEPKWWWLTLTKMNMRWKYGRHVKRPREWYRSVKQTTVTSFLVSISTLGLCRWHQRRQQTAFESYSSNACSPLGWSVWVHLCLLYMQAVQLFWPSRLLPITNIFTGVVRPSVSLRPSSCSPGSVLRPERNDAIQCSGRSTQSAEDEKADADRINMLHAVVFDVGQRH